MRYFFSTGEASGELHAVALATAVRALDPQARFEGIGSQRMRDAAFALWRDHAGWASMGPLAAIPRVPKLLAIMWRTALHIAAEKPDVVVLVDFGAFNMRLAKALRNWLKYRSPIVYWFPPGAWLDRGTTARAVASMTVPVTAFAHQRAFYRQSGLPVQYFGHPLARSYSVRPPRAAPPHDGGTVAMLPGSRAGELRYHIPVLLEAYHCLKKNRPNVRAVFGAADAHAQRTLEAAVRADDGVTVVRGVRAAIEDADAAWVSSGTAVLETALYGVPAIALYIIAPALARHARRVFSGPYITLPNLVLERAVVPEFLQDRATGQALADAMEVLLRDPSVQYAQFAALREALGPVDALDRTARFIVEAGSAPQR